MPTDDRQPPGDLTPVVGAATDIAPLGGGPKPPHERTADEERDAADWHRMAASDGFKQLLRAKRRFIVPATIFFIVYYFALPVLVGYARPLMETRVFGAVNLGLSLRAFAVFHRLDHRRALRAGGRKIRPHGGGRDQARAS